MASWLWDRFCLTNNTSQPHLFSWNKSPLMDSAVPQEESPAAVIRTSTQCQTESQYSIVKLLHSELRKSHQILFTQAQDRGTQKLGFLGAQGSGLGS